MARLTQLCPISIPQHITVNKGIVLGDERFCSEVAVLTGQRLATGKCGRPVGWRKKVKKD